MPPKIGAGPHRCHPIPETTKPENPKPRAAERHGASAHSLKPALHQRPVRRHAVIVVDALALRAIPLPLFASRIMRRILELLVGDVDLVAAELLVIGQPLPRNRIVILAEAKEAAEAHHRIG